MTIKFTEPIDASKYSAGFGIADGVKLLGIDYESGVLRFKLTKADGTLSSEVFGVNAPEVSEEDAAVLIRAEIASK